MSSSGGALFILIWHKLDVEKGSRSDETEDRRWRPPWTPRRSSAQCARRIVLHCMYVVRFSEADFFRCFIVECMAYYSSNIILLLMLGSFSQSWQRRPRVNMFFQRFFWRRIYKTSSWVSQPVKKGRGQHLTDPLFYADKISTEQQCRC